MRQLHLQLAGSREAACQVIQDGTAGCPVPEDAVRHIGAAAAEELRKAGWTADGDRSSDVPRDPG